MRARERAPCLRARPKSVDWSEQHGGDRQVPRGVERLLRAIERRGLVHVGCNPIPNSNMKPYRIHHPKSRRHAGMDSTHPTDR